MPKQMSEKNFSNLLDYYIACLEQEDLLSVTFNVSSENSTFLSTPFQTEVLFHTNNKQVIIKNAEGAKKFFQTSLLRQKNNALFYGYPIVITPEGTISPLFFIELQYEQNDDEIILNNHSTEYRLNHHILSKEQFSAEEIKNIREEIIKQNFFSALESLCTLLHFKSPDYSSSLDQNPFKRTMIPKLLNKAILYFAERSDITHSLLVELSQLKKKPLDELASTSLSLLLSKEYLPKKTNQFNIAVLEIFSLNHTQKNAVNHSLNEPLTVITGPPGTGKSQVVLNIIANAIYQNKTILFASKNNKAVDVVLQKLHAILPYKLIVRMGHQTCRKNAKANLEHLVKQPLKNHALKENTINDLINIHSHIEGIQNQIHSLSQLNDSLDKTQTILHNLRINLPNDCSSLEGKINLATIDPLRLQEDLHKFFQKSHIFTFLNEKRHQRQQQHCFKKYYDKLSPPLQTYVQHSIINKKTTLDTVLQWILTWKKEELVREEIKNIKQRLFTFPPYETLKKKQEEYHKHYIVLSQTLFTHHWVNKFTEAKEIDKHQIISFFSISEQLETSQIDEHVFRHLHSQRLKTFQNTCRFLPAWVVTNLSAKQSFPLNNNIFDILIIDEASQCDIASALPLLYRAKQIVIIGDPYQLKHISLLTEAQDSSLATTHHISDDFYVNFSYQKHSLYDLAEHIISTYGKKPFFLNEHYRCHHDIASFSNEYYYGKKLIIATDETHLLNHPSFQKRIIWHHVKGKTKHLQSPYNEEEAERVVEEILKILDIVSSLHASIGIVTLFRAQTEIISEKLHTFQEVFEIPITIGTAHRFQGDEKDIIVFSPAVSDGVKPGTLHWIQTTTQLLNVAVTRARSLFIVVGDQEICRQTTGPLKNLYDYIELIHTNDYTINSPIKQLFFKELKKQGIPIIPNYSITDPKPFQIDFALFVNGQQYIIEITNLQKIINKTQFQSENWRIRQFSEKDITTNLPTIIEELKRIC